MANTTDDELLNELIEMQTRAEVAEKSLESLVVAAEMLLECPEEVLPEGKNDLAKPMKAAADLGGILRAIQARDSDALLTAHGVLIRNLSRALETLNTYVAPVAHARTPEPVVRTETSLDPQTIERAVNDRLEARLRILCSNFYNDALELPGKLRRIDALFSNARAEIQTQLNRRRAIIEELLKEETDAFLDVMRGRIQRAGKTDDLTAYLEEYNVTIQKTREADEELARIQSTATTAVERSRVLRDDYMNTSRRSIEISEQVENIERLVSFFGVPCPPEISRQLQEVRARLQSINSESQTARTDVILNFQGIVPDLPKAVRTLFKNRPVHAAVFLTSQSNPARLFKHSITKRDAIEQLCLLVALLIDEGKGLGRKSIVTVLECSGLARGEDHPLFGEVVDGLVGTMFLEVPFKRTKVLQPTSECRRIAEATLASATDPEGLRHALMDGKRAYWEIKYSGRRTSDEVEQQEG